MAGRDRGLVGGFGREVGGWRRWKERNREVKLDGWRD